MVDIKVEKKKINAISYPYKFNKKVKALAN